MNGHLLPPGRDPRRPGNIGRARLWLWEMVGGVQQTLRGLVGTLILLALGILAALLVYATYRFSWWAKGVIDRHL